MRTMMGFGRPTKTVMQTAYVVPDLGRAIDYYTRTLNIGPFFVLENSKSAGRVYRGQTRPSEVSVGMTFTGTMNIELIEQHDDEPSILKEHIDRHGYGFHHYGVTHEDIDAVLPAYYAEGYERVGSNPVPTGGEVVFLEVDDPAHPGFLELLPYNAAMDATFTRFWEAAMGWDGSDPVRPFA